MYVPSPGSKKEISVPTRASSGACGDDFASSSADSVVLRKYGYALPLGAAASGRTRAIADASRRACARGAVPETPRRKERRRDETGALRVTIPRRAAMRGRAIHALRILRPRAAQPHALGHAVAVRVARGRALPRTCPPPTRAARCRRARGRAPSPRVAAVPALDRACARVAPCLGRAAVVLTSACSRTASSPAAARTCPRARRARARCPRRTSSAARRRPARRRAGPLRRNSRYARAAGCTSRALGEVRGVREAEAGHHLEEQRRVRVAARTVRPSAPRRCSRRAPRARRTAGGVMPSARARSTGKSRT